MSLVYYVRTRFWKGGTGKKKKKKAIRELSKKGCPERAQKRFPQSYSICFFEIYSVFLKKLI